MFSGYQPAEPGTTVTRAVRNNFVLSGPRGWEIQRAELNAIHLGWSRTLALLLCSGARTNTGLHWHSGYSVEQLTSHRASSCIDTERGTALASWLTFLQHQEALTAQEGSQFGYNKWLLLDEGTQELRGEARSTKFYLK